MQVDASKGSVSFWLGQLKGGDHEAARHLWQRYFQSLVRLAKKQIADGLGRSFDEEDVALSAFDSFVRGVNKKKFPQLDDRNDLWRLLLVITLRKAADQATRETRQKRGGGKVLGETELSGENSGFQLANILAEEATPEVGMMLREQFLRLLDALKDPQLKAIALHKMDGFTDAEIADLQDCARRTVVRKLGVIRKLWSEGELG